MMSHRWMTTNHFKSKQSSFFYKNLKIALDKKVLGLFKYKRYNVVCDITKINSLIIRMLFKWKRVQWNVRQVAFVYECLSNLTSPTCSSNHPFPVQHRVASVPRNNKFHWKFIVVDIYSCVCVCVCVCVCACMCAYVCLCLCLWVWFW